MEWRYPFLECKTNFKVQVVLIGATLHLTRSLPSCLPFGQNLIALWVPDRAKFSYFHPKIALVIEKFEHSKLQVVSLKIVFYFWIFGRQCLCEVNTVTFFLEKVFAKCCALTPEILNSFELAGWPSKHSSLLGTTQGRTQKHLQKPERDLQSVALLFERAHLTACIVEHTIKP